MSSGRTLRKAYVDLPDGQVHCRVVEGRDPAILFLHQTASSSASYVPLLRALRLPNRLVAIDTPGFGGSFDPEGDPSLADYAGWVVSVADGLGCDTFHIFGHHTGASLALHLGADLPRRVRSVILAGAEFMTVDEREALEAGLGTPLYPQADGSHLLANWSYAAQFNPGCDVELLHQEVLSMARAWRGRAQAYRAVARGDSVARARALACPALILTSPGDYFHAMVDRARAALPDAALAVTGGDNFQRSTDPDGVARAIEWFFAGL
ncbi:alpha/beta hydrolase [Sphingomonas sp. PL-96]|uniref:alpha/beta fold hydrolase n=1 Tax=Sphingomonas sp. PL-96 TaxID=2887201 RepID=UPI001E5EFAD9|nr:alpha/beta hydrolase [Sphingomonas sp. PL-96]MCC2976539.1 alpha/beta hydrolase [Sphingomonas sp. PL-96]